MDKRKLSSRAWFAFALLFSLTIIGYGAYRVLNNAHDSWTLFAAGCLCVVVTIASAGLHEAIIANHLGKKEEWFTPLTDRLDQLSILLNLMSEQQLLSDRAISIAYREKDREALRRAVHEELGRQDWDAAISLVDEMDRAFGNKVEAQALRKEINDKRQETVRKQVTESVQTIDKFTRAEQWNAALREAEKLVASFPDNDQVRNLPHEIDARRIAHKKQLMQAWHDAVARHDNDASIETLKQLDLYLTKAEAESMQDTVRGVFKEKLTEQGAQYSKAVREQRWGNALALGDEIIKDFPNSKMAQEIRESRDAVKKRVGETAAAAV